VAAHSGKRVSGELSMPGTLATPHRLDEFSVIKLIATYSYYARAGALKELIKTAWLSLMVPPA
jgi:hypothetical protein